MSSTILALVTVIAIIVGPILALYIQRKLDRERAAKDRKLAIFRTLIAQRATPLAPAFVEALNAVEVEFYSNDGSAKRVIEAVHEYFEHLYHPDYRDETRVAAVAEKGTDLLHVLLGEMGRHLGYHFEKGVLRRMAYYPQGWGDSEKEQTALRKAAVEVFSGEKALRMKVDQPPGP